MRLLPRLLLLLTSALTAGEPAGLRLLVGGWDFPSLSVIDASGREEWRIITNGRVIDCWLTESDTIIHSYNQGVREVRRDPSAKDGCTVVWDRPAPQGTETDGCQPLPGGRVLICQSGDGRLDLFELERGSLAEVAHITVVDPKMLRGRHGNSRQVRKTSCGTYLIGLMDQPQEGGAEIDAQGRVLRRFPGARYAIQDLPAGGSIGAGGDNRCLIGYDAQGTETWRLGEKDLQGFPIGFCAAIHPFADGSILVANWGGHARTEGPCLGLIAPDRKSLLWSLRLKPANRVAGFQVLPPFPEATAR